MYRESYYGVDDALCGRRADLSGPGDIVVAVVVRIDPQCNLDERLDFHGALEDWRKSRKVGSLAPSVPHH